jgi:hypothetical protein
MIWRLIKEFFMTLINVDPQPQGGISPSIDAVDINNSRMAHATTSISPRTVGTQTGPRIITKDSRIIANDGSNNIGLFGFDDAGNMVVKVAQPGYDANSATPAQLVFNSQRLIFNVPLSITLNGSNAYTKTVQVAHGLGYAPRFQAYNTVDPIFSGLTSGMTTNGPNPFIVASAGASALVVLGQAVVTVDATNINFSVYVSIAGSSGTLNFSSRVVIEECAAN